MDLPQAFYFQAGEPAVLLLHTFSGTPNDVRALGRGLQKQGYTVLGPMFTGHGTADPPRSSKRAIRISGGKILLRHSAVKNWRPPAHRCFGVARRAVCHESSNSI